jgi:Zinc finger C-x8-C-x5-C-x3-H type (and similar)
MARNRDQGPRGGAEHLARIHGTEEDKVNCPFYFKIGACRHGERCSRQHHRPPFSQTILIQHMWQNPMCIITAGGGDLNSLDKVQFQDDFNEFYDEIFEEFKNYGKLEDVQVCENLGDHMVIQLISFVVLIGWCLNMIETCLNLNNLCDSTNDSFPGWQRLREVF